MTIAKAIALAWKDHAYKNKLMNNPHAALAEVGFSVPNSTIVKVFENERQLQHLVLPEAPRNAAALTTEELELIARRVYGLATEDDCV